MTDLRQAAQQALDAWDDPAGMKDLCVAMDALRTALEQQAEPVAWTLTETLNKRETTTRGYLWFSNPQNCSWTPLYTTLPQRQWVGLTDEDVNRESAMIAQKMKLAFHAGMYVAQQILKEKNDLHKD